MANSYFLSTPIAHGVLSYYWDSPKLVALNRPTQVKTSRLDMARGFGSGSSGSRSGSGSRGSYGAQGGSGPRSSASNGRSARNGSGSNNLAEPKGQIRDGKVVQYSIKDRQGGTKYIGSTNNPARRATEHRESGKFGRSDKLAVETRPVSRNSAEKMEKAKLHSHRQQHGKNPRHNTTNDGQFHQPRLF